MSELKIVATLLAKSEYKDDIQKACYAVVDETRQEEGNISYELHQDITNPLKFMFVEVWKDQPAINRHNASDHFKTFVTAIENKFDSLEINVIKKIY